MGAIAVNTAKWTLDVLTRLIKANVRLHSAEAVRKDMSPLFVVNHFTRLETILLPYILNKHLRREVWSLAASELFVGRIGEFLLAMGTVSTKNPDRDRIIINSLLDGDHPWIIFPEGAMIKDKKVVDRRGDFKIYSQGRRRPPHTGAAVLALRAEYYRHLLERFEGEHAPEARVQEVLERFDLKTLEEARGRRTVIVPVNVTYFPIRADDNLILRVARAIAKEGLSKRAVDELSVEGTVLSEDTDIDITLGDPIELDEYLASLDFEKLDHMGGDPLAAEEKDERSLFNDAARRLMVRYMTDIYSQTMVNLDHVLGVLIREQRTRTATEREYRERAFLAVERIRELGHHRLHEELKGGCRHLIDDEEGPRFHDFLDLCVEDGVLLQEGNCYTKRPRRGDRDREFHTARLNTLPDVIANEVEPLTTLTTILRNVAHMPREIVTHHVHQFFLDEDRRIFETDYAERAVPGRSKPAAIGRPFLLKPRRFQVGIVLIHGYMAAPEEIRALADHFYRHDYAVYGVRLKGHGTMPEDLARTSWEAWYESVNRGYAVMRALVDRVVIGGFSTGGTLALLAAGRKRDHIEAAFSICAPQTLRNYTARFASTIVSMNSLLSRIRRTGSSWDFVDNYPENRHINYLRNPLAGVVELGESMRAMEAALPNVTVPTLIVQSSADPIVDPVSAQNIFDKLGAPMKELTMFSRPNHGIINGEGAEEVFDRIERFLHFAADKRGTRTGNKPKPETADSPNLEDEPSASTA